MISVTNSSDYIKRRLAGEEVVSVAVNYWCNVITINKTMKEFSVLALNHNEYSYYEYSADQGGSFVSKHNESIPHTIDRVLTSEILKNSATLRWWSCVFFEQDGVRTYDKSYDNLKIADDNEMQFEDLLKNLLSEVSAMRLPSIRLPFFITGDLAENPMLQYVLQQSLSIEKIQVLPNVGNQNLFEEKDFVSFPKERLDELMLNTNIQLRLSTIVTQSINITLPLDSSLEKAMLLGVQWKDILFDDQKDYVVSGMDFKTINMWVECDIFRNIFLCCEDSRGNRKVLQIN